MFDRLTIAIDTETTGLGPHDPSGPREDGIVQVGVAYRTPRAGVKTWAKTCNPGDRLLAAGRADRALEVNHLTLEQVLAAPPARTVATELRGLIDRLSKAHGGVELRAFNVSFDRHFLETAPWQLKYDWGPCLMHQAMEHFDLYRRPRLVDALSIAGVSWSGGLHDAESDAHAALLLHEAMSPRRKRPDSGEGGAPCEKL